jgi:hypothetical protein
VNVFREIGFTQSLRLAILHAADRYQRARLFAFISRMKGWNVRAFGDFEQAMHWLSSDQSRYQPKPASTDKRRISVTHSSDVEKPVAFKRAPHPSREHTPA